MPRQSSLSPKSVLNFLEDETPTVDYSYPAIDKSTPVLEDFWAQPLQPSRKRRLSQTTGSRCFESDNVPKKSRNEVINLRHRLVSQQTVEWLARGFRDCDCDHESESISSQSSVRELSIGPVFESSQTMLSAIRSLPSSVVHLDLDLRNALHLMPEALSLLFRGNLNETGITSLSLRFFGDRGIGELSKWIHLNPRLQRLDLSENRISSQGLESMVDAIVSSGMKLEYLNLSGNCIVDTAVLVRLLSSCPSLRTLDLSFNWMGDCELATLSAGLEGNRTLMDLDLRGCNRMSYLGYQSILKCLQRNTILQRLPIQPFSEKERSLCAQIMHLLSLNRAGRSLLSETTTVQPSLWTHALGRSSSEPTATFLMLRQVAPQLLIR